MYENNELTQTAHPKGRHEDNRERVGVDPRKIATTMAATITTPTTVLTGAAVVLYHVQPKTGKTEDVAESAGILEQRGSAVRRPGATAPLAQGGQPHPHGVGSDHPCGSAVVVVVVVSSPPPPLSTTMQR